jgi:phosphate-selective porin
VLALSCCAEPALAQVRLTFDTHPGINFNDKFTATVRIKSQNDWRDIQPEPGTDPKDVFDPYRERLAVEGKILNRVTYHVEREFHGTSSWKNVYADTKVSKALHVQAGQFNLPFGLDQTTSLLDLDFTYHSLAGSYLAPGRGPGAMVYGALFDKSQLSYEGGVFRQDGDNTRSSERINGQASAVAVGRVVVKPFSRLRLFHVVRSLETGFAFSDGVLPAGLNDLKGQTIPGDAFVEKVYVNGRRQRLGWQLQWRPGAFGVQAEAMHVRDTRLGQGIDNEDLPDLTDRAWYASGTWIVTGEHKKDRITPAHPFFNGGFGAVEIGARVEGMRSGNTQATLNPILYGPRSPFVLARADHVWTTGVNWYLNQFIELTANVIRENRDLAGSVSPVSGKAVWTRIFRIEFGL